MAGRSFSQPSVAFVSHWTAASPNAIGGVESCVRRLGAGLARLGWRVYWVVCGRAPEGGLVRGDVSGVYVRVADSPSTLLSLLRGEAIKHCIVVHLPWSWRRHLPKLSSQLGGLCLCHRMLFGWPNSAQRRAAHIIEGRLLRDAWHYTFVISQRLGRLARRYTPRVCTFKPPLPAELFRGDFARGREDAQGTSLKEVLYVGRLDVGKGIAALKTLAKAIGGRRDVVLRIDALLTDEASCRELRRLSEYPSVKSIRAVHRESYSAAAERQLWIDMRRCTAVVAPYATLSSSIDTPLIPLEAAALGAWVLIPESVSKQMDVVPTQFVPYRTIEDLIAKATSLQPRWHTASSKGELTGLITESVARGVAAALSRCDGSY